MAVKSSNDVLVKVKIDDSQHHKAMVQMGRDLNKVEREAKLVSKAQDHMAGRTSKAAKASAVATRSLTDMAVAATAAFAVMKKFSSTVLNYEDWTAGATGAIDKMRDATKGIVGPLSAARARLQLVNADFQATETQLAAVSKAAVHFARATGGDANEAIIKLSDSIISGRDKAFRQLGIDIEFTGSKTEKTSQALKVLEERFGDVAIAAVNTNERLSQMSSGFEDAIGKLGSSMIASDAVKDSINAITVSVNAIGDAFTAMTGKTAMARLSLSSFVVDTLKMMSRFPGVGDLSQYVKIAQAYEKAAMIQATISKDVSRVVAAEKASEAKAVAASRSKKKGTKRAAWVDPRKAKTSPLAEGIGALSDGDIPTFGEGGGITKQDGPLLAQQVTPPDAIQKAATAALDANKRLELSNAAVGASFDNLASGGLANFASGMASAIDSAIHGSDSFGAAMRKMANSAIRSIASQATVDALYQAGAALARLAVGDISGAGLHAAAALKFGAIAGVAHGAAALVGGGGSSAGGSRSAPPSSRRVGGTTSGQQNSQAKAPPVVINIRYDRSNPHDIRMAAAKVSAEIAASNVEWAMS